MGVTVNQQTLPYQINMAEAFAIAFGKGAIPLKYKIDEAEATSPLLNFSGIQAVEKEQLKQSWLGTPIAFSFGFKGGRYQVYENGEIVEKEMADFQLPLSTMVDLSRAKRITTTPTVGGNGTVKEMYSFDDWNVRIRGICLNDPQHPQAITAREQRNIIAQWEQLADTIQLIEDDNLFTDLGIYALVIKSISFPQVQGKQNFLPFEIQCSSDEPLELIL